MIRGLLFFSSFLGSTLSSPVLGAEPAAARSVEVVAAGDPTTTHALEDGIGQLLTDRPVALRWSLADEIHPHDVLAERAAEPELLARIWIDTRDPTRAVLYVADTRGDRFLVRAVPVSAGYDEVARESLANIIESAIDALIAGDDIGVSRKVAEARVVEELGRAPEKSEPPVTDTPPEPPRRTPPERTEAQTRNAFALLYRAELLDSGVLRHGPELAWLHDLARDATHASFGFSAGYRVPHDWRMDSVGARFQGGGARGFVGLAGRFSPRTRFRIGAGPGVDLLRVEPLANADGVEAAAPFFVVVPVLALSAALEQRLFGSLDFVVAPGVELDVMGHRYDVERDEGLERALDPWRLRPVAWLGLSLDAD